MKGNKSLTVMVPAYNEEPNLVRAINLYDSSIKAVLSDYEFIIFDDHSNDKTGEIADEIARKNKKVRVVHNKQNMGLGYNFREGIKLANKNHYMMLPGEGDVLRSSIKEILNYMGEADLLIPYHGNPEVRPRYRNIITWGFTTTLNLLFGLHVRYYNGPVVHKIEFLKRVKMNTNSFAYQAEIIIKLLKRGHTYKKMPYSFMKTRGTSIFRIKNVVGVSLTILRLFFEVNIQRRI